VVQLYGIWYTSPKACVPLEVGIGEDGSVDNSLYDWHYSDS